jgi:hypothetical protein
MNTLPPSSRSNCKPSKNHEKQVANCLACMAFSLTMFFHVGRFSASTSCKIGLMSSYSCSLFRMAWSQTSPAAINLYHQAAWLSSDYLTISAGLHAGSSRVFLCIGILPLMTMFSHPDMCLFLTLIGLFGHIPSFSASSLPNWFY